jgi:hypothetical protein
VSFYLSGFNPVKVELRIPYRITSYNFGFIYFIELGRATESKAVECSLTLSATDMHRKHAKTRD